MTTTVQRRGPVGGPLGGPLQSPLGSHLARRRSKLRLRCSSIYTLSLSVLLRSLLVEDLLYDDRPDPDSLLRAILPSSPSISTRDLPERFLRARPSK